MFFKKLILTNFMGIESRTIEFWTMTSIFGRNWSGKTSVKEAIIYAFTGAIYGTPQIDGAINNGKDYLGVVLEFEHNGKNNIIERRRPLDSKSYSSVKLNGAEVKQDMICEDFWTWEEIVSGLCVGDFMLLESVDEKFDLINNLVVGNPSAIYEEMVGADIAKKFPYGNFTHKEISDRVKSINKEIDMIGQKRQQIAARINEIGSPMKPTLTIDQNAIQLIRDELALHTTSRPVMQANPYSTKELDDIDMQIRTQEVELTKLVKPDAWELHTLKARYDVLSEQSKAIQEARVCQCCLRPFEEKDIQAQVDKKKLEMDTILEQGKTLKQEYTAALEGYEAGKTNIQSEIDKLRAKRNQISSQISLANTGNVDEFNTRLKSWEKIRDDIMVRISTAEATFRDEQSQMNSYNSSFDRIEELKKEDQDLVKSLSTFDLASLEIVQEALSPKGVTFKEMELKIAEILKFFPEGFHIDLLKKNKSNDEYKKVFDVSLSGVPYRWLSKGMKKIVDTHFANLISVKKGYNAIIIDDIESLTSSIMPTEEIKQIVTLCAKDVDFEVKVQ